MTTTTQQTQVSQRQKRQLIVRRDVAEWAKKRGKFMTKSHVSRLTSKKLTQEGRGDSRTAPADVLKVDIGSPEGCRDSPVFQAKPLEGCSIALTRQHKEKDRPTDCLELRPGIPQSKETSSLIPQPKETSTNLEKEEKDLGTSQNH